MKKIMFLFLALMIISGCATLSGGNANGKKEPEISVGTNGLVAEFSKVAPPQTVFENDPFTIMLRIKNIGTHSIRDNTGILSIGRQRIDIPRISLEDNERVASTGTSDNIFSFNIDGKTQSNPGGNQLLVTLMGDAGKLESQSEAKVSTITATLCYPYQTRLEIKNLCIDPDVAGAIKTPKACKVGVITEITDSVNNKKIPLASGQGAPIAIVRIEPRTLQDNDIGKVKPQFLMYIENTDNGNPVDPISYKNACGSTDFQSPNDARKDEITNIWDAAFLRAYTVDENGKAQLVCCPNLKNGACDGSQPDPAAFLRFTDNKDFVRCTFKEGVPKNKAAYPTILWVEIDYGYVQTVAADFILRKFTTS